MDDPALFVELAKGLGINAPLALVCWKLFEKLQAVQERERDQLLKDAELFKKALGAGGQDD